MRIYVTCYYDRSRDITEHLVDQLIHRYGVSNVRSTPSPATDRQRYRVIGQASVVLVVVDPGWVQFGVTSPDNVVVREIETALRAKKMIVPVLVHGATLPSSSQLPASIRALSFRQAVVLRPDPEIAADLDSLFGQVDSQLRWAPMSRSIVIGGLVSTILSTVLFFANKLELSNFESLVLYIALLISLSFFLVYAVSLAWLRRSWMWLVALAMGGIMATAATVLILPQPVNRLDDLIRFVEVFILPFSLLLFGLFGPRKELQRLRRRRGARARVMPSEA